MKRRTFLTAASASLALPLLSVGARAALPASELASSPLIYLSPMRSDGQLSRCQAEVWFQWYQDHIYVVTQSDAWRAQAVRQGLTEAKIWVGDVGFWNRSNERYLKLPALNASAALETDSEVRAQVLAALGKKYASEWGTWGPRFHNGLADGSRTMLRYRPTAT